MGGGRGTQVVEALDEVRTLDFKDTLSYISKNKSKITTKINEDGPLKYFGKLTSDVHMRFIQILDRVSSPG